VFPSIFAVAIGGAMGSLARFSTIILSQWLFAGRFPLGTLLVNSSGSFLVGFFMSFYMERLEDAELLRLFVVVGFLGGYTTFSSFAWDTFTLYANDQWIAALCNLLLNNLIAISLLILGVQLGRLTGS